MRSAKDAVLSGLRIREEMVHYLEGVPHPPDQEQCMISFIRGCSTSMCITSASEALELMVASNRIYDDLTRMCLYHEDEFRVMIVVRDWEDIDPEYEFRLFSFDGALCAATQYYSMCFVAGIAARRTEIERTLQEAYDKVSAFLDPRLLAQGASFTMDLVLSKKDVAKWRLIEIGHGPPTAGTSLFKWPEDEVVLRSRPFKLRILEEPPQDVPIIHPPLALFLYCYQQLGDVTPLWEVHHDYRCDSCATSPVYGPLFSENGRDICLRCHDEEKEKGKCVIV